MSDISFADFGGELHLGDKVQLFNGDSREVLKRLPDNSIDSVCCDPPYALVSIVKRFGGENAAPVNNAGTKAGNENDPYARAARGFMGKQWDTGETAFAVEFWAEVMRVLKPGGHVIAASGTRTYHRLAVAIEDAGFEIRDMVVEYIESDYALNAFFNSLGDEQKCAFVKMIDERIFGGIFCWNYGSGFPKSHDVAKGIDKAAGHWRGRAGEVIDATVGQVAKGTEYERTDKGAPITDEAKQWAGWGTALKPAIEPWVMARKPLGEKTIAANVLEYGTGALNIDGCRIKTDDLIHVPQSDPSKREGVVGIAMQATGGAERNHAAQAASIARTMEMGRWPANVIHDGSDEVLDAFPTSESTARVGKRTGRKDANGWGMAEQEDVLMGHSDSGSAARFFYSAKADALDRVGSKHPTVKPVDLMQYLCRLITPPGGIVLDPFAGSGSTGEAAWREGFRCVLIEREADYADDIRERLRLASAGEKTKRRAIAEKKSGADLGGLFCLE